MGAFFHAITIVSYYQLFFFRNVVFKPFEKGNLKLASWTLGVFSVVLTFFYFTILNGYGLHLLLLWILPLYLASAILALGIGFTLHTDGTERFDNADVMVFTGKYKRVMNFIYGFQNFHMIHHLYPKLPFYRCGQAYEILKPILHENKTTVFEVNTDFKEITKKIVNASTPKGTNQSTN